MTIGELLVSRGLEGERIEIQPKHLLRDLKQIIEDAFDSIHSLWQAAAIAYDANGDESRFLLGGPRAPGQRPG